MPYCDKHEIDTDDLPVDYTECPLCREERAIRAQEREQYTKDQYREPY
jgi:hypothetical protein